MIKAAAFLFMVLQIAAIEAAHAQVDQCSKASSHVEERSCLESLFNETDKRLAQAETKAVAKIAEWDEEPEYRSKSRKALMGSNLAFRKYRPSQCGYAWSLAAGGNGATDMRLSCAIELTEDRVRLLELSSSSLKKR